MRAKLTPAFVKNAAPPTKGDRAVYWDTALPGFGLMVTNKGARSWVCQYRNAQGVSRRKTWKASSLSLDAARREARILAGLVEQGADPVADARKVKAEARNTVKALAEEYLRREGGTLRSADQRRATFERLIYPEFGDRQIADVKRSEITAWLDDIEDQRGPQMARVALAYLSKLFNWHATRDDDFRSPVTRGMARKQSSRDRILNDDEVRAVWRAAEAMPGPFGGFVRLLLLTAARRNEVARMARAELETGLWIIPAGRMKGGIEHVIPLSSPALAIIEAMPNMGPFVFTTNGQKPIGSFGFPKLALDRASGVTNWRLHDLRRTARSLMSRAGIDADIAERCLAHKIAGVRGVYDRYAYVNEKRHAFERLAAQIERIVEPQENIILLRGGQRGG